MKLVAKLCAAAIVSSLVLSHSAHGGAVSCDDVSRGVTNGLSYTVLRRGDEALIYRLSSGGRRWLLQDFGYHATAIVHCRDCSGPPAMTKAVIWLRAGWDIPEKPHVVSDPDVPRDLSIPWFEARFDHVKARGSPRSVVLGRFRGWQQAIAASLNGVVTHDIVEVVASDGCAFMHIRIEAPPSSTDRPIDAAEDVLNSIQVSISNARSDPMWPSLKGTFAGTSPPKTLSFGEFRRLLERQTEVDADPPMR